MKKALSVLAFALAASAVFGAEDSVLYWMVNDVYDMYKVGNPSIAFDYAMVSVDGGNAYLKLCSSSGPLGVDVYELESLSGRMSTSAAYSGYFDALSQPSFLIQLFSDTEGLVGWHTYSYSEVSGSVYNGVYGGGDRPFVVTGGMIPEPSCGLLTLLGLAVLSLKRRAEDRS